jgi:formate dehydrogenase iron-sulfur subunit
VPGRPSWNSRLTIVQFLATGAAIGPLAVALVDGPGGSLRALGAAGSVVSLAAYGANLLRLARDGRLEYRGTWTLTAGHLRGWFVLRSVAGAAAIALTVGGPLWLAIVAAAVAELVGRWLFYVSVVPLNMPGAFFRGRTGAHR